MCIKWCLLENCNYIVQLSQLSGFSLVGVAGSDLAQGLFTPILAFLWQLMRAYTLSLLTRLANNQKVPAPGYQRARSPVSDLPIISEREIIDWVNNQLKATGKTSRLNGFGDLELRNSLLIIDLLDAISPGCVDYDVVNKGIKHEVCAFLGKAEFQFLVPQYRQNRIVSFKIVCLKLEF